MTRRRWIADRWDQSSATLTGADAAHLARVLRAAPGMRYDVVAGERVWQAEVVSVDESEVSFALLDEKDADRALPITLLLAVFKFDRLEWAIEKSTELGVARIVPVLARRTEKHLAQAAAARLGRWKRIAHEAAKQSRRSDLPTLDAPVTTREAAGLTPKALRLLLSETERDHSLSAALKDEHPEEIALAIGPEGGWAADEITLFTEAGWQTASLGSRILRAETAAISATAIVSALLS